MRKALWAVCFTGLFLLMLSALVVTPEDALPAEPVPPLPLNAHLMFAAMPAPSAPVAQADAALSVLRFFFVLLPVSLLCAASLPYSCDSNGRILTSARYENSVYQLFRPEVAGG